MAGVLLAGIVLAVYWPGLSGPFLLDDFTNLLPLASAGGDLSLSNLLAYLESGWSGPTGRPLSLASFFLNAQDWLVQPWAFKLTNLCLHLFNGFLAMALTAGLLRLTGRARAMSCWAGLAVAAVWLLHPIQVSTVLYVTQRMTILAALFTLLGLGGYVAGRAMARTQAWRGLLVMTLSVAVGTALATLSKESGVLLPLYALVLEATLLTRLAAPAERAWRLWRAVLLVAPCIVLAAYFVWTWDGVFRTYSVHEFDVFERLLTQPRVLLDYLAMIIAPWTVEASLYHADFPTSTGLFSPPATAFAIAAVAGLLAGALILRRRLPVLAFAMLWFFAGHALESSFLALEMYYEHRNYLPLLGPAFALVYYLMIAVKAYRPAALAGLGVFILGVSALTLNTAFVWGDTGRLSQFWAAQSPESGPVQQFAAQHWLEVHEPLRARDALHKAVQHNQGEIGVALQLTAVECLLGTPPSLNRQSLLRRAKSGAYDSTVYTSLDALLQAISSQRCGFPDLAELLTIERLLIGNPRYQWSAQQARLHFDLALALLLGGKLDAAIAAGAKALSLRSKENVAGTLAELLHRSGQSQTALAAIQQMRAASATNKPSYRRALTHIENAIKSRTP